MVPWYYGIKVLGIGYRDNSASKRNILIPYTKYPIPNIQLPNTQSIHAMKILLLFFLSLLLTSCSAQKKTSSGMLKGKVEIGPLCPQEPCNPTPERLKQVYDSYEVILMDTTAKKILFRIPIQQDATFIQNVAKGEYIAMIKPVSGTGFRNESKRVSIVKGKTTDIILSYDTGIR
jgi:hypothetical protein